MQFSFSQWQQQMVKNIESNAKNAAMLELPFLVDDIVVVNFLLAAS